MGESDGIAAERHTSIDIQDGSKAVLHDHGDKALGFLETHEQVFFTRAEEKAVIWKIDRVLMPLV